jgi:hypothetical protein
MPKNLSCGAACLFKDGVAIWLIVKSSALIASGLARKRKTLIMPKLRISSPTSRIEGGTLFKHIETENN